MIKELYESALISIINETWSDAARAASAAARKSRGLGFVLRSAIGRLAFRKAGGSSKRMSRASLIKRYGAPSSSDKADFGDWSNPKL